MFEPIVFISHLKVKEGKLDGLRPFAEEMFALIGRDKPGTVVFLGYLDEDAREIHMVHAFPDADAMDQHLEGVGERAEASLEFMEIGGYEIYGSPRERTLETMRGFASSMGVPLVVRPDLLGGYLRPGTR